MRLMQTISNVARFVVVMVIAAGAGVASTHDSAATSRIDELAAATSLDRPGIAPWHLRMTFELFGLDGNPGESGTIEEWWISPTRHRVVVASPSLNETLPRPPDQVPLVTREAYLVNLLVNQTVHPVSKFSDTAHFVTTDTMRKFGNVSLSCLGVIVKDPGRAGQQYCNDPDSKNLRVVLKNADRSLARNDLESFMDIDIARDQTIAFGGLTAIKGHIDLIEAADLEKASLAIGPATDVKQPVLSYPHRTNFVQPRYPSEKSAARTGGVVTIRGLILKDGYTGSLEVIATSGPNFSQQALDAIKNWKYKPMLRDGIPSAIDSTITVIFLPQDASHPSKQILVMQDEMDREAR